MTKLHIAICMSLALSAACVCASGSRYEEIGLEEVVTNSTFIVQAEYVGEGKDDYGPHSKYTLQKVIYSKANHK